jgi:hypothetical protein
LQERAVGSRYSTGLATGTGTDQIGIAARLSTGSILTGAGHHCVLGELIGKTVHAAVLEALRLQNSLTTEGCRSTVYHLQRFGATRESLIRDVTVHLSADEAALFEKNFLVVERDPLVVAAIAALVHIHDEITWGILPSGCVPELWATYGAQIAAAVSGDYSRLAGYRDALAVAQNSASAKEFLQLVSRAIALGFSEKWADVHRGSAAVMK